MEEEEASRAGSVQRPADTIAGNSFLNTPVTPAGGRDDGGPFEFLAPPYGPDYLGWLSNYRVVKLLGAGGMGLVFQAEDSQLLRPVALKVVRPELAKNAALRERFLREAQAMAALKCDHIVVVHQVGEAGGLPFLAMEFLEGESLEQYFQKPVRPDVATVLRQGKEIALGLAAAHEHGLIHRDIKPANLFIEQSSGRVKILDFGLARPAKEASGLTEAGTILGTPHYMAPEQAVGGDISPRSDLFSLGCVLYRLLAGETPFAGGNTVAVLMATALNDPRPLREVNTAVPLPLADLVTRLLAKNPADRPASAAEVADALDAIARDLSAPTPAAAPPAPPCKPKWQVPAALIIACTCVLLAALCAATYFLRRPGGADSSRGPANSGADSGGRDAKPTGPSATVPEPTDQAAAVGTLNGGGSTFIYPLLEKWGAVYRKETGVKLNYVATGSGSGIQQLTAAALDFCCSDVPMTGEQLMQARAGGGEVLHVPLALGGIVPAYNLEGLGKPLRFSGNVLAGIYLGDIKKWNDPALQELNPDLVLPDREIVVIHRADGSGSSYIFTDFLSKASKDWRNRAGTSATLNWPVGIAASGNEGMVDALVKRPGAIAYVELLYALRMKLLFGAVKNKQGNYLQGSLENVTAAAEGLASDIPADLRFSAAYAPGKDAYPICGCTWAILYVRQPEGKGQRLLEFLRWATQEGQDYNTDLFYARLPPGLAEKAQQKLKEVTGGG
jgi:phosphate ABC transporter phosphate-binding protein